VERTDLKPRTLRARDLRSRSTDAEWKIWSILRNRQLGGFKFRRQVPIDRYFADFACLDARLVVEIDGSQHTDRADYDAERTRVLESLGWRVIRFGNFDALNNPTGVGDTILFELGRPPA
jgi:very-short-patch-repair endonuclease